MDASDLAAMQEAINTLATLMNAIIAMSGAVRQQALDLGISAEAADEIAVETFRSTLRISFPALSGGEG